jgi:hypothetical protein
MVDFVVAIFEPSPTMLVTTEALLVRFRTVERRRNGQLEPLARRHFLSAIAIGAKNLSHRTPPLRPSQPAIDNGRTVNATDGLDCCQIRDGSR